MPPICKGSFWPASKIQNPSSRHVVSHPWWGVADTPLVRTGWIPWSPAALTTCLRVLHLLTLGTHSTIQKITVDDLGGIIGILWSLGSSWLYNWKVKTLVVKKWEKQETLIENITRQHLIMPLSASCRSLHFL